MRQLLSIDPPPDAVFCNNDLIAVGALRAIFEQGLKVPEDIALIGVSNLSYTGLLKVPLSSIDQSAGQIGDRAAIVLLRRMETGPKSRSTRTLITPKLVVRESSASFRSQGVEESRS